MPFPCQYCGVVSLFARVVRAAWSKRKVAAVVVQGLLEAVYGREQVRGMPHEPNRAFAHLQSIRNEVTSCMDRGSIEVRERDKKRFRCVAVPPPCSLIGCTHPWMAGHYESFTSLISEVSVGCYVKGLAQDVPRNTG